MSWPLVEIGDVSVFVRNGVSIKQDDSSLGLPITRIETISSKIVNLTKCGYANIAEDEYLDYRIKKGDILISHINSEKHLGKCAIFNHDDIVIHGMNLLCLRANNKAYPKYIFHALSSSFFLNQIPRITKKSVNQASFTVTNFKELQIPLPSLPEQIRIAAILDKADAIRRKRQQAIQLVDDFLRSVFLDMFGDPVTNPKGWKKAVLGNMIFSATDGPHVSPNYAETGIPFLSTRHVRQTGIVWDDMKFITKDDALIHWKKCKPENGDILYTKGGTTGIAKAIDFDKPIAIWVHIALLKTNKNKVSPLWLEAMLNSSFCYHQSQRLTRGIVNRDLGLTRMINIEMYLPPIELQYEFAARVQQVEALKAKLKVSLATAEEQFKALIQQAFTKRADAVGLAK